MRFSYESVFQNIITLRFNSLSCKIQKVAFLVNTKKSHNLNKITLCLYGVKIGTGYFEDAHHCFMTKTKKHQKYLYQNNLRPYLFLLIILINCLIIHVTINCVFVALAAKVLTEANNVIKEN